MLTGISMELFIEGDNMFERYTDGARRAVVLAQDAARGVNQDYIGTEHLLIALFNTLAAGPASTVLQGFAAEEVVKKLLVKGEKAPIGHIPFSIRAKHALEFALREALRLENNYIGTGHILLGILRLEDGRAIDILKRLNVDLTELKTVLEEEIQTSGRTGVA